MWAQRSRLLWARQGDKNSKYFHCCATKRHRKNLIEDLRVEEDSWKTNQEDITKILISYYQDLFTSSGQMESSRVWECVPNVITDEMNALLSRQFEAHEVEVATLQVLTTKSEQSNMVSLSLSLSLWTKNLLLCYKDVITS